MIGVDPGLSGALAMLEEGALVAMADIPVMVRGKGAGAVKNEVNAAALAVLLREWVGSERERVRFIVEQVNAMPAGSPGSRRAMGASGILSMGDTSGCIRGVIAALGCSIEWVAPATWKAYFKLRGGQDMKEAARAHAIRLFPEADLARKKDHNRAEAALIARWYVERHAPLPERPF